MQRLRSIAAKLMDDPLVLWAIVALLIADGVLLAMYITGVL